VKGIARRLLYKKQDKSIVLLTTGSMADQGPRPRSVTSSALGRGAALTSAQLGGATS
jgi:hypothetical protein